MWSKPQQYKSIVLTNMPLRITALLRKICALCVNFCTIENTEGTEQKRKNSVFSGPLW
jgi:hypothetical protein